MQTPQLLCSTLLVVVAATACNRTDADAQRTREQVNAAAKKAGDQLADSWLTTKIQAQYFADDDIKARHINVSTRDGIVTLTGYVDGEPQRKLAVQIASTTDGVRGVTDRLTIDALAERRAVATSGAGPTEPDIGNAANAPPAPKAPDDAQLTSRIQAKLTADDRVKDRRIIVDTRSRIVTLSGDVADEDERAHALLLARTTDGVARVEDHLTVMPESSQSSSSQPSSPAAAASPSSSPQPSSPAAAQPPSSPAAAPASPPAAPRPDDQMVTTMIQAKYFVDPAVKTSAIDVSVKDGVVLLQGRVPGEAARKQALAIAGNTEGVVQVVDRLTVAPAKR